MPEAILISTLVMSIFTGLLQIIQSYIDYKRDKINKNDNIYEIKNYHSNCCNINTELDSDNN